MTTDCGELYVGKSARHGLLIRLCGRFTMIQSRAFEDLVGRSLQPDGDLSLTLDLIECEYLDSTFLGCLVKIHKQYPTRVVVGSDGPTTSRLFGNCPLHALLTIVKVDEPADDLQRIDLPSDGMDKTEFGRHILHCHRQLAALPGPMQAAFGRVVDQLERELRPNS